MEHIDVAVIGAGVTGLASARAIAARGFSTCVLDRHPRAGMDTSTHNSGVIHAGIYYPPGTLKARLCVEGRHLLYEFCAAYGVPFRKCGKLVVAHEADEIPRLEALEMRGLANGVEGLQLVDRAFITAREPAVNAVAALWSAETGIVDAEELVRALLKSATDLGVVFLPGTRLVGADRDVDGMRLTTERETIHARVVVNAAGLYADEVSALLGGEAFTIYPGPRRYAEFVPAKRHLVNGLVYPPPATHGLGVHLVKTTNGQVWLGPDGPVSGAQGRLRRGSTAPRVFREAVARLIDGVTVADLRLSGSGIRAKLHPESVAFADFLIRRDCRIRSVHAAGIESPGLPRASTVSHLVRYRGGRCKHLPAARIGVRRKCLDRALQRSSELAHVFGPREHLNRRRISGRAEQFTRFARCDDDRNVPQRGSAAKVLQHLPVLREREAHIVDDHVWPSTPDDSLELFRIGQRRAHAEPCAIEHALQQVRNGRLRAECDGHVPAGSSTTKFLQGLPVLGKRKAHVVHHRIGPFLAHDQFELVRA